LAVAVTVLKLL